MDKQTQNVGQCRCIQANILRDVPWKFFLRSRRERSNQFT